MSVTNALLALLIKAPMHGYELKAAFEDEFASLWTLNYGQLYPALEQLEESGLVDKERVIQDDRPDKKVYTITQAGRKALTDWMDEPCKPPRLTREEFHFKLMAARVLPSDTLQNLVAGQRQVCLQALGEWTRGKAALDPVREPVALLLAESMVLRLEAELKWLDIVAEHARCLHQLPEGM